METYFEILPVEMLELISDYLDRQDIINLITPHLKSPYNYIYFKLADKYNDRFKDTLAVRNFLNELYNRYKSLPKFHGDSYKVNLTNFDIKKLTGHQPYISGGYPTSTSQVYLNDVFIVSPSRYEEFKKLLDIKPIVIE